MKCYSFAVFWNFRILKVVLGYKKWSKTAENEDSQRKIVELSNDMSDVFLAFLEMKCDTPYPTLFKWGEFMDSCEGSSLKMWILAFWTILVNACWPHVCDMRKFILGPGSIYLKSLPPKYHVQKCKIHHEGSKKPFFVPTRGWWNNHLIIIWLVDVHFPFRVFRI